MTCFYICLSKISFFHIYITCTKSFYKLYSNFPIFTVLSKLLSMLLYNKIYHNWDYSSLPKTHEQRYSSAHKETIVTSNNSTKVVTKSNPTERCPKSTQYTRRKTPTLTCKSNDRLEVITLKSQVSISALPGIHRIPLEASPMETSR